MGTWEAISRANFGIFSLFTYIFGGNEKGKKRRFPNKIPSIGSFEGFGPKKVQFDPKSPKMGPRPGGGGWGADYKGPWSEIGFRNVGN